MASINLSEVMNFAIRKHEGQMYGGLPYATHLSDVYGVLLEFDIRDNEILASAWLHDVLEDGDSYYNTIKTKFGERIAEIVYAVSDEKGRNRKERHDKTWPGIRMNDKAVIVKQADIIANMRMGIKEGKSPRLKMYRNEYIGFKEFFKDKGDPNLWTEMDRLN